jgi:hypothetical protein
MPLPCPFSNFAIGAIGTNLPDDEFSKPVGFPAAGKISPLDHLSLDLEEGEMPSDFAFSCPKALLKKVPSCSAYT